jgi:predicted kinase
MLDMDPRCALDTFRILGLETPAVLSACDRDNVVEQMRMAFRLHNSEGGVVYALAPVERGASHTQRVVKMYKSKNATYIILRAVREKLRAGGSLESARKRLEMIREFYPEPVDDFVLGIEAKALRFFRWMRVSGFDGSFDDYASRWIQFCALEAEEGPIECELADPEDLPGDLPTVVMIIGPVGAGKTTLGKAVAASAGGVYIDQDESNGILKIFLKNIAKALETHKLVVIGKTNVSRRMRASTLSALKKPYRLFVVEFEGVDPAALLERLEERGLNHPTLRTTPGNDFHVGVLQWFLDNWEPWTSDEAPEKCVYAQLVRVPFEGSTRLQAELVLGVIGSGAGVKIFRPQPKFVCVVLPYSEIYALLGDALPAELEIKKEFHVTLWHADDGPIPENIAEHVGQRMQVSILGLVWNKRVAAMAATIPRLNDDELHVTVALAKGVKAVEAKTLGGDGCETSDRGADILGEVVLVAH